MTFVFIPILWNKWSIRGIVLLSLLLQIFLILFAPLRKKTMYRAIIFLLWLAYLMADSVATFGIGLSADNSTSSACVHTVEEAIQAFWTSFLLLHLGGPDTITAFSLEDNFLWQRHVLNLIFEVAAAIYVFAQVFPSHRSLVTPTMLVFLAAIIKNLERLMALYLSSLPRFRRSMLSHQRSSRGVNPMLNGEVNALEERYSNEEEPQLPESIVVKHAYCFFQIFKVFIGDLIYSSEERRISCQYFQRVSPMDALRVISIELQFIYEVLHTKALAIHSVLSYFVRFIAFTLIVIALVLFNRVKRDQPHTLDVEITYSLLLGGIALDVIALFMLVFSDWTVVKIKFFNRGSSQRDSYLNKLVSAMDHLRKPQFAKCEGPKAGVNYTVLKTPFIFRRWSESISACNLVSQFLKESPKKMYQRNRSQGINVFFNICCFPILLAKEIISCLHQARETMAGGGGQGSFKYDKLTLIANTKYVSKNPFIKELWIYILKEVRRKSRDVNDPEEVRKIFDARGDLFLQSIANEINCGDLLAYVTDAQYDFSIITWHIATEIWYNMEEQNTGSTDRNDEREFSKILSDYMVYLLLNQSNVVSAVGGIAQMTAAEVLFGIWVDIKDQTMDLGELCRKLYAVPETSNPTSPLRKGIKLAQQMGSLGEGKWKVMGGVWVEMLSYAAIHITGHEHVLVLSKGGEFLAFVWLLMAHLGCFYKPEWGISHERFETYQVTNNQ